MVDPSSLRTPAAAAPARAAVPVRRAFWLALVATIVVHLIPGGGWLGRPLVWLASLVHELGHGLTALATGGRFVRLDLHADGSGVAQNLLTGPVQGAVVAAGGLVGPSIGALFGFALARGPRRSRVALAALALGFLAVAILEVRTGFGIAFLAGLIATCGALAVLGSPRATQLGLMFLSLQLALALWDHLGYMFSAEATVAGVKMPSDSAQIAAGFGGPYWLWGALCAAISLAALAAGGWLTLRRSR
jgi:hypothetical protein